jgi:hypothetical protein
VVVTNPGPGGHSERLTSAFTYVPPDTFNFNAEWIGFITPAWTIEVNFTIENDTVVKASCRSSGNLLPTMPAVVTGGAFSFVTADGGSFAGHVVANGEAAGTINVPGCGAGPWYGWKK